MTDRRLRPEHRIRQTAEFDRVFASGTYATDEVLVVSGCPNHRGYSRLGLSVSRKVGNAVLRNRWKRLIREAFRHQRDSIPSGVDFVVRPRRGATCDGDAIRQSLPRLARLLTKRLQQKTDP